MPVKCLAHLGQARIWTVLPLAVLFPVQGVRPYNPGAILLTMSVWKNLVMQYLAKVQKKAFLGGAELLLLAEQISDTTWELVTSERMVETAKLLSFQEGNLVLVEVNNLNQVTSIQDAVPWVLELVQHYLSYGMTPETLEQEIERAERWRQSLTLKSQDVDRRALETAARRDEIQELERNLKQEREELEARWQVLKQQESEGSSSSEPGT